ncbi:DUF5301 domain-containing protein [Clostridium sp.]|uniref:DUF5301 domain-containing protein n=1 Tax=Clostridium sp. TaxID=1506 RepID=UPI0039911DA3
MRKNRKMIIFSMAILLGAIMHLSIGGIVTSKQISDLPEENEVSYIEIYHDYICGISKYHSIEGDAGVSEIYSVLLSGKKNKTLKSVNDLQSNVNGKLTKIVLTDSSNKGTSLFTYQGNDGKYYIEKPYEGIYEISVQGYETLTQYFIAS